MWSLRAKCLSMPLPLNVKPAVRPTEPGAATVSTKAKTDSSSRDDGPSSIGIPITERLASARVVGTVNVLLRKHDRLGWGNVTISLEDKVHFHGEDLVVKVMFTRAVEVKLLEPVLLGLDDHAAIDHDLKSGAQVPYFGTSRVVVEDEVKGSRLRCGEVVRVDIDGGLVPA
jgi:hypothetical protein